VSFKYLWLGLLTHASLGRGGLQPAVPMNAPRLRTCVRSSYTEQDIELALSEIEKAARKVGLLPSEAIAMQ
jgi:7-keto-8-aminopelargonate synthetase-like enzyme